MKIGIVGATGMIGHHVARAVMNSGHELFVIHRESSDLGRIRDLSFVSAIGDLDDCTALTHALSGIDAVINCAGYYPTVPRAWREDVKTGMQQMQNFYQACARSDLQKIVYVGATIALQKHPEGKPGHAELEYPTRPEVKNPYLQVKWAMDKLAIDKAKEGLPVVIAIPSMTFGEFDYGPTTGRLVMDIANRTLPAYVRGDRNIIYAGDAGRGLLLACEKGKVGERYLLTGRNISMDELIRLIASLVEVTPPKAIPLALAKVACRIQEIRYKVFGGDLPKLSSTAIAVLSAGQFLDGSKAEKQLGFRSSVSLEESIHRTVSWFREVGYIQ
jgi:nucleoside-diphosphate-sugar epimerase